MCLLTFFTGEPKDATTDLSKHYEQYCFTSASGDGVGMFSIMGGRDLQKVKGWQGKNLFFGGMSRVLWRFWRRVLVKCSWVRIVLKILLWMADDVCLAIHCDLFGMVKWPFWRLSDLQLGDKKVTLNHLVCFVLLLSCFSIFREQRIVGRSSEKCCQNGYFYNLSSSSALVTIDAMIHAFLFSGYFSTTLLFNHIVLF